MRSKVTLVLIFLNVVLFFFIFRFERGWHTERTSLEARSRVLGAEAADIRTLDVSSAAGGPSYRLERRGEHWFLTRPYVWPANTDAVNRILNDLQLLEHETSFGTRDLANNGQSLADYGLAQPKLVLSFTSGDPAAPGTRMLPPTVLKLGDTTRKENRLYLLSADGSRIHVVDRALADSLSLPLDQLRADTVFTIPVFEVRFLSLQTAAPSGPRVRLRRDGSRWRFERPMLAIASKSETELTINGLDSLRAVNVLTAPTAVQPSASPSITVTLEGNNRDETLYIGAETGAEHTYYGQLKDHSPVFTVVVPPTLLEALRNAQDELRDRHVLDFDAHAVTSIALLAPNQPELVLQRLESPAAADDGAGWQVVRRGAGSAGPQTLPADRSAVKRLLEQLALVTAVKFQSDSPTDAAVEDWGLNRPEREITLTLGGHQASQITLQLGLPTHRESSDYRAYARLAGTASVYEVDSAILRETPVSPLDWRDRLLRELPAAARITSLVLSNVGDSSPLFAVSNSDGKPWEDMLAGETPARRAAILVIRDQLRTLRALTFVQDGYAERVFVDGEVRPWKYRLEAKVSLPGGTGGDQVETLTLMFTDRIGSARQYAGSKDFDGVVFAVEQPFVDALWTLTYAPRGAPAGLPKGP